MATLRDAIDAYNAEKAKRVPPEILAAMARATAGLKNSGIEDRAPRRGDTMPSGGAYPGTWPNRRSCSISTAGAGARIATWK